MPERVRLDISIETLRDVRHAVRTAIAKHVRKMDTAPNPHRRASHALHADRLRLFLRAIDEQVGDIKYGR